MMTSAEVMTSRCAAHGLLRCEENACAAARLGAMVDVELRATTAGAAALPRRPAPTDGDIEAGTFASLDGEEREKAEQMVAEAARFLVTCSLRAIPRNSPNASLPLSLFAAANRRAAALLDARALLEKNTVDPTAESLARILSLVEDGFP